MAARAKQLIYQGKPGSKREGDFFYGIPARDLDAPDIAALDDAQYRDATGDPGNGLGPLYVEPKPKAPAKPKAAKPKVVKPAPAVVPEAAPAADAAP